MGASYSFSNNLSNYASATAQTKYASGLTGLSIKMRVKGSIWTPNYQVIQLLNLPNRDGFHVYSLRQDTAYQLGIYTGNNGAIFYTIPSFTADANTYYTLYFQNLPTAGGGVLSAIGDASGTLIAAQTSTASSNLGGTTGEIEISKQPTTASAWTLDGVAIYNVALSGASRFSAPATGDSGIIGLYKFDEGTGTSVADATGGTALTISGTGTWNTGDGAWDATVSTGLYTDGEDEEMRVIPSNTATAALRRIPFTLVDATDLRTPEDITVTGVKPTLSIDGGTPATATNDIVKVNGANGEYYIELTQAESNQSAGAMVRGWLTPSGCALTKFQAQIAGSAIFAATADVNVATINSATVIGNGTSGNLWRGA